MAADDSLIDVQEAARRLNRSPEQVRRYLREGRLRGERVNNRWYVDANDVADDRSLPRPELSRELGAKLDRLLADIMGVPMSDGKVVEFRQREDT